MAEDPGQAWAEKIDADIAEKLGGTKLPGAARVPMPSKVAAGLAAAAALAGDIGGPSRHMDLFSTGLPPRTYTSKEERRFSKRRKKSRVEKESRRRNRRKR